jgi:hypothetical protein
MLTALVPMNFAVEDDVVSAGRDLMVDERVSIEFAVKYVLKYRLKINKKGFEMRNLWGVKRSGFADWASKLGRGCDVAAFVTMERSMTAISGATRMLALAAEVASAQMRRPRLDVFHWIKEACLIVGFEADLGEEGGRTT